MELTNAQRWDNTAGDYQRVFQLGQNEYNEALFRYWEEENMFRPGCRVLDIGCGVGKYAVMFAEKGCDVTLTDISEKMLQFAAGNMASFHTPWKTFCCDFSKVTGEEEVFWPAFDFTISTLSPAVNDADTLGKMCRMTDGWCFLARFCSWKQTLRDTLLQKAGMETGEMSRTDLRAGCDEILGYIAAGGYVPKVRYVEYNWYDIRTPEEMANYLIMHAMAEEKDRGALENAARSLCDDTGKLKDEVQTHVAWISWNTRERQGNACAG